MTACATANGSVERGGASGGVPRLKIPDSSPCHVAHAMQAAGCGCGSLSPLCRAGRNTTGILCKPARTHARWGCGASAADGDRSIKPATNRPPSDRRRE
uniref:Uncharacterized protein n=1 Tax=Oryza sativa subsp. japonica TaxID=39947 RepID=Q6ZFY5_ORYSJ|nr:hypothetical protein [Oryza sativa Japonica Group]BAD07770.1 hypothetical protein [Oryza sativa Japonica Group]